MTASMQGGSLMSISLNENVSAFNVGPPTHLYKLQPCTFLHNDMIFVRKDKKVLPKFQYKVFNVEGKERHPIDIDAVVQEIFFHSEIGDLT